MKRRLFIPDKKILYRGKDLVFTGSNYVDTGIKLWDVAKNFTLLVSYQSYTSGGYEYYTIFGSEYASIPYPGFMIDMESTRYGGNPVLGRAGGCGNVITPHSTSMKDYKKCIVLKNEGTKRTLFSNDKYPTGVDITPSQFLTHQQTVLLGCAQSTSGVKNRYWNGIIYTCNIYSEALTDQEIIDLMNKEYSNPKRSES